MPDQIGNIEVKTESSNMSDVQGNENVGKELTMPPVLTQEKTSDTSGDRNKTEDNFWKEENRGAFPAEDVKNSSSASEKTETVMSEEKSIQTPSNLEKIQAEADKTLDELNEKERKLHELHDGLSKEAEKVHNEISELREQANEKNKEADEKEKEEKSIIDMKSKLEDRADELGVDLKENSSVANDSIENKFGSSNLQ